MADDIAISVMPDGASSWIATVEWPDGTSSTREFSVHMRTIPDVILTDPAMVADMVEAWVRARPEEWRP